MQVLDISLEYENQVDNMKIFDLQNFFHQLQLATKQRKLYFVYKNSKDLTDILKILQKTHIISGYTEILSDTKYVSGFVKIFLRYDIKGDSVIKEIITVSAMRQRLIINYKQIKTFLNDYPYVLALIRTRLGILDIKTCEAHRIGGEFLAYIK
jgi:ribosomal protein S8